VKVGWKCGTTMKPSRDPGRELILGAGRRKGNNNLLGHERQATGRLPRLTAAVLRFRAGPDRAQRAGIRGTPQRPPHAPGQDFADSPWSWRAQATQWRV
jgi:hypothetical protein